MNIIEFRKIFLLTLLSTLVLCISTSGCKKKDIVKKEKQLVITAPVIEKKISKSVTYVGKLEAEDSIELKARVTGFLTKQNFKDGDFVKKGDLLFVIDKKEFEAALDSAKSELAIFIAEKKAADIDLQRKKYLVDRHAISELEYEEALSTKEQVDANIAACEANIKQAELNLSYTDIYAPFEGKIGVGVYSIGDIVGPASKTLATLIKLNPIRVNFNVSESLMLSFILHKSSMAKKDSKTESHTNVNALKLRNIQKRINPVLILSNGVEYKEKGRIYYIDNKIDKSTGTVLLKALYPNPNAVLLPGGHVRVKLVQTEKEDTLLIPQQAVQEDQAGQFVLVVNKNSEVEIKKVETGMVYDGDVVLKKGLNKGEQVIIEGSLKVQPGDKVDCKTKQQDQNAEKQLNQK